MKNRCGDGQGFSDILADGCFLSQYVATYMDNFFKVLGLTEGANEEEIGKAFRVMAQQYHPDRNPGDQAQAKFRLINEAYQTLKDPKKRLSHLLQLKQSRGEHQSPPFSYQQQTKSAEDDYRPPQTYQDVRRATSPPKPYPRWMISTGQLLQLMSWGLSGAALGFVLFASQQLLIEGQGLFLRFDESLVAILMGLLAGITLPQESHLQVSLKQRFQNGYPLIRAIAACLSGLFFGAIVGNYVSFYFETDYTLTIFAAMLLGEIVFGLIAAEETFWTKLRFPRAYFEFFFVLSRMLGIGLLIGLFSWITGYFLSLREISVQPVDAIYYGLVIGLMVGSIRPSDLLAYARYASAYTGRWMVLLMLLLATLLGLIIGVLAAEPIQDLLGLT